MRRQSNTQPLRIQPDYIPIDLEEVISYYIAENGDIINPYINYGPQKLRKMIKIETNESKKQKMKDALNAWVLIQPHIENTNDINIARYAKDNGMFKDVFKEIKDKAKEIINNETDKITAQFPQRIKKDLEEKGLDVVEIQVKKSKFKGHPYISSAPILVRMTSEEEANNLLSYLQKKYSPKYKLKGISGDGIVKFDLK